MKRGEDHGEYETYKREENNMDNIWLLLLIIVGWVVLNRWVLPKLGIST
ncbi:MAG: hypothetical protein OEV25_06045 [Deltaproteobacteria bacterium]|nr:hypothetical protein [Deltaproteobacteria bacterium]MDH3895770.1 hypothetical protein [Deltaproteobacteria bacterium]MDH3926735.1 hypothetical protein [Deltaproteobacteria bacterium]MDH3950449.1 hypothetical protein [Deltaproteobacteria bacterium]MDH3962960.1 hypothetical protein [Deltaproteobacteria bacterium]